MIDGDQRVRADNYFKEKENSLVLEPGFTFRAGYKAVRGTMQYNLSTFSYDVDEDVNINQLYFSIGLQVLITKRNWQ